MEKRSLILSGFLVAILGISFAARGDPVTTKWGGDAQMLYDNGFMHMLMKNPQGGVYLFNMDLIENDSPGAGDSEKGDWMDSIWGKNRSRKLLVLDDPRAEKAYLVAWYGQGKYPLGFSVNGNNAKVDKWDPKKVHNSFRWTEFPPAWLKKGRNVIEFYCPEAASKDEGWRLFLARADEFEHGGGDPKEVGKTSFKSTDGGETWKESPFGPLGKTLAEYTARISLDRYVKTGWLESPVIDLWRGDAKDFIVPVRIFKKLKLTVQSEVPEGTSVEYYLRKGTNPGPFSSDWSQYELIGTGSTVDIEMDDRVMDGRYVQLRAVLSTTNPLKSPVVKSAHLTAELLEGMPQHTSIKVARCENPDIKYSSVAWEWEPWDRPEFKEVRARENLDDVVAGSKTEFEKIVKLREYAATRTTRKYGTPMPGYPGWDALSILDRIDKHGSVGMCIQFNNLLMGLCMAYGIQGRLINGMNHEMAELWSDDFGKWVYMESSYGNHNDVSDETLIPMSLLELHNMNKEYLHPDKPIDWMNELTSFEHQKERIRALDKKPPESRSSTTWHQPEWGWYEGLTLSIYMRAVPRNNFYEKPFPLPLTHGATSWPWNGYICYYDDRTPPMRQYTWYTDRPRDIAPDLNLVHVDATTAHSNKYLYLRFETYTPNFSHFEMDENDNGWKKIEGDRWTWALASGKSTLRVRAVNKLGAKGKPSCFEVYRIDVPLKDLF
ncbi:MAG: transglutaminase-like domain-containing protein [Candidatus Latescibacter sp.]|nr:transglutaminase-like domain-containing protein [Candidatus Latescibacter sp.]